LAQAEKKRKAQVHCQSFAAEGAAHHCQRWPKSLQIHRSVGVPALFPRYPPSITSDASIPPHPKLGNTTDDADGNPHQPAIGCWSAKPQRDSAAT
jgi:hypothetical protein